ncbi:hypothetical protein LLE49_09965 [Alicyclobacillus tolerans]|uniref:acyl-CoA dehydrogenase family protein n=1 Tax=Alicyclobacillus tolerans TaxID=90970 RepID=UPI001F3FC90B|nr:acyl-CoA dehydrogenase family protein [Alicyclobacillus tolerans]MCF8565039.1 hypothetical protein [Alicyclobacillus tolerans]
MDFQLDFDQKTLTDAVTRLVQTEGPVAKWPHLTPSEIEGMSQRALKLGYLSNAEEQGLTAIDSLLLIEAFSKGVYPGPFAENLLSPIGGTQVSALALAAKDAVLCPFPNLVERYYCVDGENFYTFKAPSFGSAGSAALVDSIDPLIQLAAVPRQDLHEIGVESVAVSDLRDEFSRLALGLAASLLGIAEGVLAITTSYAKERVQFGRPIGSFQAVKHQLANVYVANEKAYALLYRAGFLMQQGEFREPLIQSACRLSKSAASLATKTAIQVHGGIGFTWEATPHLFLKRAIFVGKLLDSLTM